MGALVMVLQVIDCDIDVLDEFVIAQRSHVLLHRGHLVVSQLGIGMLAVIQGGGDGDVTVGCVLVTDLLDVAGNPECLHDHDDRREVVAF